MTRAAPRLISDASSSIAWDKERVNHRHAAYLTAGVGDGEREIDRD